MSYEIANSIKELAKSIEKTGFGGMDSNALWTKTDGLFAIAAALHAVAESNLKIAKVIEN